MAKILTLTPEEAQQLRNQFLQTYKSITGKDFTPVTYLGAYDDLRTYTISKLSHESVGEDSEAAASISVHRLRKLFYYTDPVHCSIDKLEVASFGEDFILPIKKIILQNRSESDNPKAFKLPGKSKMKNVLVVSVLLSLAFIILYVSWYAAQAILFSG